MGPGGYFASMITSLNLSPPTTGDHEAPFPVPPVPPLFCLPGRCFMNDLYIDKHYTPAQTQRYPSYNPQCIHSVFYKQRISSIAKVNCLC